MYLRMCELGEVWDWVWGTVEAGISDQGVQEMSSSVVTPKSSMVDGSLCG
jgi:hypothetical protein